MASRNVTFGWVFLVGFSLALLLIAFALAEDFISKQTLLQQAETMAILVAWVFVVAAVARTVEFLFKNY
jgi:hypothetical protein